ncbi:hypothetical protein ACHAXT_000618 [Thalassiosira profunda]
MAEALVAELLAAAAAAGGGADGNEDSQATTTVAEERELRSRQLKICEELTALVRQAGAKAAAAADNDEKGEGAGDSFIRTSLTERPSSTLRPHLRDAIGNVPSSTASALAAALAKLVSHRAEIEDLLPATQDAAANNEAISSRAAPTLSALSLAAARLYVELIGTKGAWGAGMVDAGGIGAVTALIRRWGVECRGRENVMAKQKTSKGNRKGGSPAKKKSRVHKANALGARKSVRISEFPTIMNLDEDEDDDMSCEDEAEENAPAPDLNATFYVDPEGPASKYLEVEEPEEEEPKEEFAEKEMIMGGLELVQALGQASLQADYKNWSPESREFYVDGASAALGIASALLAGCKGKDYKEAAAICQEAVSSLENALRTTVAQPPAPEVGRNSTEGSTAPRLKKSARSRRKSSVAASNEEKRQRESGVYLLRGLLPLFNLKVELPNGQAGKMAAHETASGLLVGVISSICEDMELNPRGRVSIASMRDDSLTPKRGGRKSVGFSHTPANNNRSRRSSLGTVAGNNSMLAPPSLKKSITPRRTRNSSNSTAGSALHPILTPILGLLQRIFTSKGLERAESRSRAKDLGTACLAALPSYERAKLLKFVGDMCESKVSSHRMLGAELLGEALCQGWFWRDHDKMKEGLDSPFSEFDESRIDGEPLSNEPSSILLAALRGRLNDKSPTVRTRAALSLGEVARRACEAREKGRNLDGTVIASSLPSLDEADVSSRALAVALCEIGSSLVDVLRHRASTDESASVRKSCITAWLRMLELAQRESREEFVVSGPDISALCQLCNDSSVATRKAAADALTRLVQANYDCDECTPQASSLEVAWAHTVLPLVSDAEATCVAKAVGFFSELVVEPILELAEDTAEKMTDDGSARYYIAWRVLAKLSDGSTEAGGSRNASGALILALQKMLVDAGKDSKSLAKNLLRAVYHTASIGLGLDRRSSLDSTMSHDQELEEDLFDARTSAMRAGAWCLLDALTSCLGNSSNANVSLGQVVKASRIDASFLTASLQKLRALSSSADLPSERKSGLVGTSRDCLKVMSKMGSFVPVDEAEAAFSDLLGDLKSFTSVSIDLVSAALGALIALTNRSCDESGKDVFGEVETWSTGLLGCCESAIESRLSSFAQSGRIGEEDGKVLSQVLYLIGETTMIGFSSQEEKKKSDVAPTDAEPVRGLILHPSKRVVHLVKLMLPESMPMPNSEDRELTTPSGVRAHAFIALGKLCLRDEALAKESLTILARELHRDSDSDPAVQSNALMVMGDLCVRYTNLVDRYLPFMAGCLQAGEGRPVEVNSSDRLSSSTFGGRTNRHSLVKKNAIMLLSSLLLQDYIKWRGLFVHRFLAAVADEDDEVSCLAQTAIRGPLLEKQPNLLCNHFVGAVFVFNACKAHPLYEAESSAGGNGLSVDFEGVALEGSERAHRRREVYENMLSNLTDEQKLQVTARLVKEILGGALEVSGDLSAACKLPSLGVESGSQAVKDRIQAATNVLTDTLAILTSPEIKVGRKGAEEADDDLASANGPRPNQRSLHKQQLLKQISRKHLMEIVIPILCNLKTVLEGSHSPLLRDLMHYLGYIFRGYKSEVQELLANDPSLLQELEYDTREYLKKRRQRERESSILQTEIVSDERA